MNNDKKRILLVTRNLPPLVGGMENLLFHCAGTLHGQYSLSVVGPSGCASRLDESIEVREVPGNLIGFLLLAPLRACILLFRGRFDLIFGGSGLVSPICWALGKLSRTPTLCYVHGLDVVVDNRLYQAIFVPCLRRLDAIIVNSANTRRLCLEAGVEGDRITIIHPGCEVPTSIDRSAARRYLSAEYGVEAGFIMLFVGRVAPRKGLLQFFRNGFAQLIARRPDSCLVIAGDRPGDSLAHGNEELQSLKVEVEKNGWADRVRFLGKVDDDILSLCYAGADCLLFPLVHVAGDVEGFGMVAIEAAASGTPTVAFNEGGVSDALHDGVNGSLLAPGDYDAMVNALASLQIDQNRVDACRSHAGDFAWDKFDAKLLGKIAAILGKPQ